MATKAKGRIHSRPNAQKNLGSNTTGARRTGLDTDRDGILYVPESFNPKARSPLLVMFHGAGGDANQSLKAVKEMADRTGTIVLAPESQGSTWDLILSNSIGRDIEFVDEALSDVFALYPVDPKRVAVAGFADGASYALSVGLINGDLFTHIIAFTPGFYSEDSAEGSPRIFISHGTTDTVLPIDRCSRKLAPKLEEKGFEVEYREFAGGHTIPAEIGQSAMEWFLDQETNSETKTQFAPF